MQAQLMGQPGPGFPGNNGIPGLNPAQVPPPPHPAGVPPPPGAPRGFPPVGGPPPPPGTGNPGDQGLSRFFSPEVLAQAQAGNAPPLPPLPTQKAMTLEEIERQAATVRI